MIGTRRLAGYVNYSANLVNSHLVYLQALSHSLGRYLNIHDKPKTANVSLLHSDTILSNNIVNISKAFMGVSINCCSNKKGEYSILIFLCFSDKVFSCSPSETGMGRRCGDGREREDENKRD